MNAIHGEASPRVSVLVLAYRHLGVLDAVTSVTDSGPTTSHQVRVLLNGASREVEELVRRELPADWVEESTTNLGFAGGMNLLAARTSSEFILMMNDDAIATEGWLDALVAAADETPRAAAVTGRLYYPDGRLQEAGARLTVAGHGAQAGNGLSEVPPDLMVRREIDFASCSAALVRREAFDEVGGFDETYYPAYYEDADLSLRLREAGWSVIYDPAPVAVHAQGQSSTGDEKHTFASYAREVFLETWGEMFSADPEDHLAVPDVPIPPRRSSARPIANADNPIDTVGRYVRWLDQQLAAQRSAATASAQRVDEANQEIARLRDQLAAAKARHAAAAARAKARSATIAAMRSTRTWRTRTRVRAIAGSIVNRARGVLR